MLALCSVVISKHQSSAQQCVMGWEKAASACSTARAKEAGGLSAVEISCRMRVGCKISCGYLVRSEASPPRCCRSARGISVLYLA